VSQVSFFEIAIKLKIGKLPDFDPTFGQFIESVYKSGFKLLPFRDEHLTAYSLFDFPGEHRDPFDRYLVVAADYEQMPIISKDDKFALYADKVEIIW
jgi:PIN domain nuclease of toxin-antitoxin system